MQTALERLRTFWQQATPLKRGLALGVPILVVAIAGTGIGLAVASGGDGSNAQAHAAPSETATEESTATATTAPSPTETPASAGAQADPGAGGGQAPSNYTRVQPRGGTGPGAPSGTGMSLSIPSISVNASVYSRTVGTNGVMGNPSGAWDVIWYDFSGFDPGAAGYPGEPGANAVFAGHVDYIHVGPAVFWSLRDLGPGAGITVNTPNGAINYAVQWSRWAGPDEDFAPYIARTGQDAITLVTCIGGFSNGHYSNRLIVRAVRV